MDENGNGKAEGMATDGDFDLELERLIRAGRSLLEVRDTERSGEEMREMLEKLAEEQAQIEEVKEFWPQPVWKYLRYGPCGITQKVYLDAPECFAVECREPGWKDNLVTMFRMVTDIFGAWDPSLAVVLARARDLYMAENCAVQEEEDDEGNLDGQENDDGAGRDCFAEPRNDNSKSNDGGEDLINEAFGLNMTMEGALSVLALGVVRIAEILGGRGEVE